MQNDTQTNDKVYHRDFHPTSGESLALVAKQISTGSSVLDIGCGAGDLGEYLQSAKQCTVIGVDYSASSVAIAKEKLNDALQLDLHSDQLENTVNGSFDVIVMADILEHIYTPIDTLRSAEKLLKPDGKIIISIPNAGYVGALLSLYDNQWQYREEGILDRTHIRFYTKQSVMEMLDDSGFDGYICDRAYRDLLDSEFTQRIDCQPDAVRNWLLAKPEGSAYQFIVEARPKSQQHPFPKESVARPMNMQHIVKCYWQSDKDESFSDDQMMLARGHMGEKSKLTFNPQQTSLKQLRFDFADRRSLYHLYSVEIISNHQVVWSSQQNEYLISSSQLFSESNQLPMTTMAINEQANIILTLPKTITGDDLSIIFSLSAPVGEQNTAFSDSVSLTEYQHAVAEQHRLASELAKVHAEAGAYIEQLKENLERESHLVEQQNSLIEQGETEISALTETLEQWKNQCEITQQQVDALMQSSSWKLTAPLRKFISLFK